MDPKTEIVREADRCVMCGLCLPHCPTYALSGTEPESPRGRIALALALARGQLPAEPSLAEHLESCLVCRACEDSCPSKVAYGRIITAAREILIGEGQGAGGGISGGISGVLIGDTPAAELLRRSARAYSGSTLQSIVRRHRLLGSGRLARLERLLPGAKSESIVPGTYPAQSTPHGRVQLFTGCVGELADAATLSSAVAVITRLGYAVSVPGSGCCGAIDWHAGRRGRARERMAEVLARFTGEEPVIAIASGCGGFLHEYGAWSEGPEAEGFAARVQEIGSFLARQEIEVLPVVPPAEAVMVHEPCSLRHVLHDEGGTAELLGRLGFDVRTLDSGDACCGAAGDHMLRHAARADRLRAPHIEALAAAGARYLVSANVGCALHLAAGAREAELDVEVLHPVTLIGRHLQAQTAARTG